MFICILVNSKEDQTKYHCIFIVKHYVTKNKRNNNRYYNIYFASLHSVMSVTVHVDKSCQANFYC